MTSSPVGIGTVVVEAARSEQATSRHPATGPATQIAGPRWGDEFAVHLSADLAAAVAARDPQRLSTALTEDVRLRALLPGGVIESHGGVDVAAFLIALFADFDTVEVEQAAGQAVADRQLLHYRLRVGRPPKRWVCTQTTICTVVGRRLAVIDLLCSGFRKIGDGPDDDRIPSAGPVPSTSDGSSAPRTGPRPSPALASWA